MPDDNRGRLAVEAGDVHAFIDEMRGSEMPLPDTATIMGKRRSDGDGPYELIVDHGGELAPQDELWRAMESTLALIGDQDFEPAEMLYRVWGKAYHTLPVGEDRRDAYVRLFNEIVFCLKMNRAYDHAALGEADLAQAQLIECDIHLSRIDRRRPRSPEALAYARHQHGQCLKALNAIGTAWERGRQGP
ncbi:hypothetical protein JXB02_04095 [Candidatus Woesearchaeota archaeon]|nr:hypothetical protein [Candidatus Woesearchaeota archaeon]